MQKHIGFREIFCSQGGVGLKAIKVLDLVVGSCFCRLVPSLKPAPLPTEVLRILVIRPGGIGDAVLMLPILKALQDRGTKVGVLCERRNADIFISQGYDTYDYRRGKDLWELTQQRYEVVVDTEQWHYLSALLAYFCRAQCKIGFGTRPLRSKLFHKAVVYDSAAYELLNFRRLFDDLLPSNALTPEVGGSFNVSPEAKRWAATQVDDGDVALFVGASIPLRRLRSEQAVGLIRRIFRKQRGCVLLGGKDVVKVAQEIEHAVRNEGRLLNTVGQVSLMQSAALIQRCRLFIGPDSGLMHLACAVGAPVIAVFGPGNVDKWRPQGGQHRVISAYVPCSPCTHFGYTVPTCKGSYICLKNINLEEIDDL